MVQFFLPHSVDTLVHTDATITRYSSAILPLTDKQIADRNDAMMPKCTANHLHCSFKNRHKFIPMLTRKLGHIKG